MQFAVETLAELAGDWEKIKQAALWPGIVIILIENQNNKLSNNLQSTVLSQVKKFCHIPYNLKKNTI